MIALRGDYMEDGFLAGRGTLDLNKTADGFFCEFGGKVCAYRYAICEGVEGVAVVSSLAAWKFSPDAGEVERVGMPVLDRAPSWVARRGH